MAYPKKTYRRKRGIRRRRGRMGIYRAAGSQLWKDVKFLKSVINAEKKYFDTSTSGTTSSTGSVTWLSNVAQGTAGNQRTGNGFKAVASYMQFEGIIAAAATTTFLRYILFIDKETRGTTPLVTEVLATSSQLAPLNMSNTRRFKILDDHLVAFDINGKQTWKRDKYINLSDHMKFDTSGGVAISNAEEGHLFLLLISDQATNVPAYAFYHRLRFYDN